MPDKRLCRVIENEQLSEGLFSIVFDCSDIACSVRAGQFVHIACGKGLLLRRPISVCDVDSSLVKLVFAVKGKGTAWLSKRKQGDQLDILGPLGNGFDLGGKKLLLVGGGVGIPPMLLAARQAKSSSPDKFVRALLGFADASKAILLPEFAACCSAAEISTDDGSLGKHGFVTELLSSRLEAERYDSILACGPMKMLSIVARIAEKHKVPCQVSLEQRMGCGVGACLVCSCKVKKSDSETGTGYLRACADGPVFDSREVCWDEA